MQRSPSKEKTLAGCESTSNGAKNPDTSTPANTIDGGVVTAAAQEAITVDHVLLTIAEGEGGAIVATPVVGAIGEGILPQEVNFFIFLEKN